MLSRRRRKLRWGRRFLDFLRARRKSDEISWGMVEEINEGSLN